MKRLTLFIPLLAVAMGAYGQGFMALDNNANTSPSPTATANGLFFIGCPNVTPIIGDFNAAFYGGTDSANLSLIRSFTGTNIVGDNAFGPGTFTDPTGNTYSIPGATNSAFFRIEAWTGNFSSLAGAEAGGAFAAVSPIFQNPVALVPNTPPDLTAMPAIVLGPVDCPEPGVLTLAALGAVAVTSLTQRKSYMKSCGGSAGH